jgi:hypothetical protein
VFGPARPGKLVGSGKFALPVFDLSLFLLNVEINLAMRIGELKIVTLAFTVTGFFTSYCGIAMVR